MTQTYDVEYVGFHFLLLPPTRESSSWSGDVSSLRDGCCGCVLDPRSHDEEGDGDGVVGERADAPGIPVKEAQDSSRSGSPWRCLARSDRHCRCHHHACRRRLWTEWHENADDDDENDDVRNGSEDGVGWRGAEQARGTARCEQQVVAVTVETRQAMPWRHWRRLQEELHLPRRFRALLCRMALMPSTENLSVAKQHHHHYHRCDFPSCLSAARNSTRSSLR